MINFTAIIRELRIVNCDGILKFKGRLGNSELDVEVKEPVILPKDQGFTVLVVESCYERAYYSSVGYTGRTESQVLGAQGRQVVQKVLSKCFICHRLQGRSSGVPIMATLPKF